MYAHSPSELVPKPVLTKTRLCKEMLRSGSCSNATCGFAHEVHEVERSNSFFRSKLCQYGAACKVGDNCRYAHAVDEIRPVVGKKIENPQFGLESPDDGFPLRKGASFASTRGSFGTLMQLAVSPSLLEEVRRHDHASETYFD